MASMVNFFKGRPELNDLLGIQFSIDPRITEEAKKPAALRKGGETLLTGGRGLEDDEDIVKKKTLLGA